VLREQCNGYSAEGGDMTAHAERLLVRAVALTQVGVLRSPNGVSFGRAQAAALTLELVGTEAIVFSIWDAIW
jgi:hypothetical protein